MTFYSVANHTSLLIHLPHVAQVLELKQTSLLCVTSHKGLVHELGYARIRPKWISEAVQPILHSTSLFSLQMHK